MSPMSIFIIIVFVIFVIIIAFLSAIKAPNSQTYKVRSAGSDGGFRESFINVTGSDADEKKIELSDDYWTDGKFKF